jgi:hypothetical protein
MSLAKLSGDGPASGNAGVRTPEPGTVVSEDTDANPLFVLHRPITDAAENMKKSRRVHKTLLNFRAEGVVLIMLLMGDLRSIEIQHGYKPFLATLCLDLPDGLSL